MRMMKLSVRPPAYAAMSPIAAPSAMAMTPDMTPTASEMRSP